MVKKSIYLLFKLQKNILYKKYIKDINKSFTTNSLLKTINLFLVPTSF